MAPIKFEDQLREKLEERHLQPTVQSWTELQERLDKHESKTNSFRFWWIGIAASIIGVILVITQFYKSTDTVEQSPVIVNSEKDSNVEVQKNAVNSTPEILVTTIEEKNEIEKKELLKTKVNSEASNYKKAKVAQKQLVPQAAEESVEIANSNKENEIELTEEDIITNVSVDQTVIENVVAEVKAEQSSEVSVSSRQIDSLLKEAQKDLLQQKLLDETRQTVSADALLQDAEFELEQSFRAKVFEALKTNFNSVKTAVANRNN